MRISIIGLAGSGKSTFATAISKKLSIPHIHLDRFWFEANGLEMYKKGSDEDKETVRALVRERTLSAIAADEWVSDGIYLHVQTEIATRADFIVYLDIPLWLRLFRHTKRSLNPSARHSELNMWHEVSFFFEIIRREFKTKPKLEQFISEYKNKIVVLKSQKEIEQYLNVI